MTPPPVTPSSNSPGPGWAPGQRRIVITGGPCSGKTTLIEGLARRGFPTVPEAAIQVIADLVASLGLEEQAVWRAREPGQFQRLILERQRQMEAAIPRDAPWVFLDRGVHDGLGYLLHRGTPMTPELRGSYGPCGYHRVFVMEMLRRFDGRADTGRTEDRIEARAIRESIRSVYAAEGVPVEDVPEMVPVERENHVLRSLRAPASGGRCAG